MIATWSEARKRLQAANELRIIGYSVPVADAYIKERTIVRRIDNQQLDFNQLETAHEDFFENDVATYSGSELA